MRLGASLAVGVLLALMPLLAASASVTVVEFYNPSQDHYFITAAPQEIADLDAGVHPGWQRTGLSFDAYASATPGASPVCRFYIPPRFGDSHFFSASPAECLQTRTRFPAFDFESEDAFDVFLPDVVTGACPVATVAVYRLWNGRADTNHRYTTDRAVWRHMVDLGWTAEGYGTDHVAMCVVASRVAPLEIAVTGRAVIKAQVAEGVVAFLEERSTSIFEDGPDRVLALLRPPDASVRTYRPPSGWSLADFAVHPSGDVSVVLTTARAVRIARLDRNGSVRFGQSFVDPAAARDPFFEYDGSVKDDDSLQPVLMHDAARVVPLGEDLALVLRTGRNAVVAYRLNRDATGTYERAWRTLVEPGSSIDGVFLFSGSFDTFGQLANHVGLHVDVDGNGTLAVGVVESPFRNFVFQAHSAYFGESIAAQAGILVTRIAADGRRLGSTVIDTHQQAELHGLRATPAGFVLQGRVRTEVRPDVAGWDAYIAAIATDGSIGLYRVIDVDRGDILFDAVMLPTGRYLALGTTGYVQNPGGASISEDAQPLLVLLGGDGAVLGNLGFADGPRQDQLRTIVSLDGRWLVGGIRNGPGTHSGDTQPQLITADGFLVEMNMLPAQ